MDRMRSWEVFSSSSSRNVWKKRAKELWEEGEEGEEGGGTSSKEVTSRERSSASPSLDRER